MNKLRLARIEKRLWQVDARPCFLCWGEPLAVVVEDLIEHADRPGFRGERRLDDGQLERITPDLHCRRCGKAAKVLILSSPLTEHAKQNEGA